MIQKLRNVGMVLALAAVLLGVPTIAQSQILLNTTTNSVAVTDTSTRTFTVASTANITVGAELFVPRTAEIMCVTAIPVSGTVTVRRGCEGTFTQPFAVTSTLVIIPSGADGVLGDRDMSGACTRGLGYARYSPYINRATGTVWVCRSSLWQGSTQTLITHDSLVPFTP